MTEQPVLEADITIKTVGAMLYNSLEIDDY